MPPVTTCACWSSSRPDGAIVHGRFRDLPQFLAPGDLVVVNTSATLPAAVPQRARTATGSSYGSRRPRPARIPHASGSSSCAAATRPFGARPSRRASSRSRPAATAPILAPYAGGRLWLARLDLPRPLDGLPRTSTGSRFATATCRGAGRSRRTRTSTRSSPAAPRWPSAGRPFTAELITELVAGGVLVAPIVLHTGVSSQERHERPYPERYRVPEHTARLVNAVHAWGGRVIATGTTVVRALETVARQDGTVDAGEGWTDLVVTPERGLRTVDGLLTGLHEPDASHLDLLSAAAGPSCSRAATRRRSSTAIAGTSSATAT